MQVLRQNDDSERLERVTRPDIAHGFTEQTHVLDQQGGLTVRERDREEIRATRHSVASIIDHRDRLDHLRWLEYRKTPQRTVSEIRHKAYVARVERKARNPGYELIRRSSRNDPAGPNRRSMMSTRSSPINTTVLARVP